MQERQGILLIVIPTRNRALLAKSAIESVLRAQLSYVNVLVSDNSTEATESAALRDTCEQYRHNGVSYVRSESSLSMAKHWDWAMHQALKDQSATHFLYLTDRMVFKPRALERLCRLAIRYPEKVISFTVDRLNDNEEPITVTQQSWTNKIYEITSASTLKACSMMRFEHYFPRMLNSVVPRVVMERFLDRFGNCFSSVAPDFNFCFRYLLLFDSFVYVDRALLIHYALARSNGATQQASGLPNKDNEDLLKTPSGQFRLEGTPLPEVTTVGNFIMYEYVQMSNHGSRRFPQIDKDSYLAYLNSEVAGIQDPQRRLDWQNALQRLNDGKPVEPECVNSGHEKRSEKRAFVRRLARRAVEVCINVSPKFISLITPTRLRSRLAANKWKFRDSERALFCAMHFECPIEQHFPSAQALECTVLTESVQ